MRNRKIQERVARRYLLDIDTTVVPVTFTDEELSLLAEGIENLAPPVCRQVIELHFRTGLTFSQIARKLGVSETTVYKHLRNALNQLRKHISNY